LPHLLLLPQIPARYVWSRGEEYSGGLRGLGLFVYGDRFRRWDAGTAVNVTRFVANSEHTARQVASFYKREAGVVYPGAAAGVSRFPAPGRG